jgi:hypothetical protein
MVVLLVYGKDSQPLSLVVHGHDDITWFYVVNTPSNGRMPGFSLDPAGAYPLEPPLTDDEPALPEKTDQTGFQSASL